MVFQRILIDIPEVNIFNFHWNTTEILPCPWSFPNWPHVLQNNSTEIPLFFGGERTRILVKFLRLFDGIFYIFCVTIPVKKAMEKILFTELNRLVDFFYLISADLYWWNLIGIFMEYFLHLQCNRNLSLLDRVRRNSNKLHKRKTLYRCKIFLSFTVIRVNKSNKNNDRE